MALKYLKVKTCKLYFDNLSIRVSQSKTIQVETMYTFKKYLYIVTSSFFSQNKVEKICLISWGVFNKTNANMEKRYKSDGCSCTFIFVTLF